jgi:CHASE2 domain-containing sensor protein
MAKKYLINVSPKVWTILSAWFHVFVGGVLTEYIMRHTTSVKGLLSAGIAAIVPLIYRYVNPADTFPHPSTVLVASDNAVKN